MPKHVIGYDSQGNPVFDHELGGGDAELHQHSGLFMRVLRIFGIGSYEVVDRPSSTGNEGMIAPRSASSRDRAHRN